MSKTSPKVQYTADLLDQLPKQELIAIILKQQELIELLQQRVERLEKQLKLDSQTSSKPPSTELLKKTEHAPKTNKEGKAKQRRPGGQPGHMGKTRKGFGRVERYEILRPQQCSRCGSVNLSAEPLRVDRQQVAQLVERPIEVVEYQRYHCQCEECGETEIADWPTRIVPGQDLGVSLQALLVWLGNQGHLPYEKQQEFLQELGTLSIGLGTLVATNSRMADAVSQPVDRLWDWAVEQPHVHVDETPWPVKGIKEWLWVIGGKLFSLFHAADTRSRAELEQRLGESFDGVLSSDDYSVYNGYPAAAQQKCLAHLRRHFKRLVRLGRGEQVALGQAFMGLIDEAFEAYRHWQQMLERQQWQVWAEDFRLRVQQAIEQWFPKAGYDAGKLLRSLRNKSEQWWYFLDHPEIPPDNNLAERLLRLGVTKRKVSGGSRSMHRFEQTADLLSVIQTCRLQVRSVIQFFQQALTAAAHPQQPMPSLIPEFST